MATKWDLDPKHYYYWCWTTLGIFIGVTVLMMLGVIQEPDDPAVVGWILLGVPMGFVASLRRIEVGEGEEGRRAYEDAMIADPYVDRRVASGILLARKLRAWARTKGFDLDDAFRFWGRRILAAAAVAAVVAIGARVIWPGGLESRVEGRWKMGEQIVELKNGAMLLADTSIVLANYSVLDHERVQMRFADSGEVVALKVTFDKRLAFGVRGTANSLRKRRVMTWSFEIGRERRPFFEFIRI